METFEYESLDADERQHEPAQRRRPGAFERANYMKALSSFDNRLP